MIEKFDGNKKRKYSSDISSDLSSDSERPIKKLRISKKRTSEESSENEPVNYNNESLSSNNSVSSNNRSLSVKQSDIGSEKNSTVCDNISSGNSPKTSLNGQEPAEGRSNFTAEDFQNAFQVNKAKEYYGPHTQTQDIEKYLNAFNNTEEARAFFTFQNKVIDYNNAITRANIAADTLEDEALEENILSNMESGDALRQMGVDLYYIYDLSPAAYDMVTYTIAAIGNILF